MPRHVDLRLESLLKDQSPDTGRTEFAEALGISDATLRAYLENRWTVLDRTVLERMADYFQCDAGALLSTRESSFFEPFRRLSGDELFANMPTCLYLIRPDADVVSEGRPVAHRDHRAIGHLGNLLQQHVDELKEWEKSVTSPEAFQEALRQNTVVLGSPWVNPATEMAICRVFGVEPFAPAGREKLPFTFRVPEWSGPSAILEPGPDRRRGIWLRHPKELIETDYWPLPEFKRRRVERGRDSALVLVVNHALAGRPESPRKLIVLAGFGGTGTEAAAMAVATDYRDLEPTETSEVVWGVIEVFYGKRPYDLERAKLTYNWRCRSGGRCPVVFSSKKPMR